MKKLDKGYYFKVTKRQRDIIEESIEIEELSPGGLWIAAYAGGLYWHADNSPDNYYRIPNEVTADDFIRKFGEPHEIAKWFGEKEKPVPIREALSPGDAVRIKSLEEIKRIATSTDEYGDLRYEEESFFSSDQIGHFGSIYTVSCPYFDSYYALEGIDNNSFPWWALEKVAGSAGAKKEEPEKPQHLDTMNWSTGQAESSCRATPNKVESERQETISRRRKRIRANINLPTEM